MLCRASLNKRYPCLSLEEAVALAEALGCDMTVREEEIVFKCRDCGGLARAAYLKPIAVRRTEKKLLARRTTATMDPLTARLMVNLARVKPGDKVLEPFVGAGAVAVEAERVGAYVVGIDIDIDLLRMARLNTSADLIHGDASLPPLRPGFDAVVGDPPYGRLSIVEGEVKKLLYVVVEALLSLVKPGGSVVLAGPIYFDLNLYSCSMYLHGGLYRLIYIIRANREEAPRNIPFPYTSGGRSSPGTV